MNQLDYIIIGLFSLVIVTAGMSFRKSGSDMKSYFAAGGAVPWGVSSLSLYMSFFSAGTFVVWGSIAYQLGFVAITIQMMMCFGGFLVGAYIAPRWKRTGVLTAAEFIRKRLGAKTQQFYTYLILFLSLGYTGAFLYPVAKIVNVSTGFSIDACVIALGLLIILYTVVGGLWAVIVTDVLQFVILTAAVIIVVILSVRNIGGFENFIKKAPANFFSWSSGVYSPWFLIAFLVYNTIFIGGNWAYVQRYTSVKNEKSAKKVGYLFSALYLVSPFIWMLPPMIYRITNPGLSGLESEGAYLLACKKVLPLGMMGLMLGGMIFATASSVVTVLNLSAAVLTNDVYLSLKPKPTLKNTMRFAKISTLIFGLATIGVALLVPAAGGIVEVVLSVGAVTGCSLYGPPVWAIFSKRQTGKSILWITILSLGINIYFKFINPLLFSFFLDRAGEMLLGALTPFLLLSFYEIYASRKKRESEDYQRYKISMQQARPTEEEIVSEAAVQNTFGLNVLAYTLAIVALLIAILGIFASANNSLVIGVGAVILLASLIISPKISFAKNKS